MARRPVLTVSLDADVYDAYKECAARYQVSMTALLQATGERLVAGIEVFDAGIVARARAVVAERRRRGRD